MKKLLFLFLIPLWASSQTTNIATVPLYAGNLDSAKLLGSIAGLTKNFYGVDVTKKSVKYTDTAAAFAGYTRLNRFFDSLTAHRALININTAAIAGKQSAITLGATSQYFRGDLSLATFPTIPTNNNQLTNGSNYITASSLSPYLTSATAASTYALLSHTHIISDITGLQAALNLKLNITDTANKQPRIIAGPNTTITGTFPNVIISSSGSGGSGSGTVNNSANANRLSYYVSSGTAVDPLAAITANRALISDANGLPIASSVTATELGYVSGVTSAIQTQIGSKVNISDTASMLSPYLRSLNAAATYRALTDTGGTTGTTTRAWHKKGIDSLDVVHRALIALKVNISDTAAMLSPYLRSLNAAATYATITNLALKVNISDTAAMLANYKAAMIANTANIALKENSSDTNHLNPTHHITSGRLKAKLDSFSVAVAGGFVDLTNGQSISGIKQFNSQLRPYGGISAANAVNFANGDGSGTIFNYNNISENYIRGAATFFSTPINKFSGNINFNYPELTPGSSCTSYGDSYSTGVGASVPDSGYLPKFIAEKRFTNTNRAVSGSQVADQAVYTFNETPAAGSNYTYFLGVNDQHQYGTDTTKLRYFKNGHAEQVAWLGISNNNKILATSSAITYTGTWTVAGIYNGITKYSGTNGATATFSVYGTTVLISTVAQNSVASSFNVSVDGVTKIVYTHTSGVAMTTVLGATYMPYLLHVDGLSDGMHTVVITLTSSANTFLNWVAGAGGASRTYNQPTVYVSDIPRFTSGGYSTFGGSDANVYTYNATIKDNIDYLASIGVNCVLSQSGQSLNPATDMAADGAHPNDAGHDKIYKGFLWASNAILYPSDRQRAGGAYINGVAIPTIAGTALSGTGFVKASGTTISYDNTTYAPLASPALTGTPTAPTASAATNTTQLATTAHVFAERTNTATLTNKRWTARVGNTTSSATPTINTDNYDIYKLTAQAADITSFTTNLTGTPVDGDVFEVQITGTAARAITWGASFVSSSVTLPTTTVTTATLTVVFQYYTTSSYGNNKWVCANYY